MALDADGGGVKNVARGTLTGGRASRRSVLGLVQLLYSKTDRNQVIKVSKPDAP